MNGDFPRIITLLRKERGISQKEAAQKLGISQALLSHYEKGIRECGLEFIVKSADFYGVSCDYLLGRSPERTGAQITIDDIPEPDAIGKENAWKGSVLPTLNKKLIANSLNILYDLLSRANVKALTTEMSAYLMLSVYKMFRILYSANGKNPAATFSVPNELFPGLSDAALAACQANCMALAQGHAVGDMEPFKDASALAVSPEWIAQNYPLFATSLFNVIQNAEERVTGDKKQKSK